jgi:monofunctional biosynthetic peptidoglycan transglycosylase
LTDDVDDSAPGGREDEHRRPWPDGTDGPPPQVEDGQEPDAGLPESPRAGWRRRLQLAGLVVTAGFVLWLLFTWLTWPDVAALADRDPATTAFIERYREARRDAGEPDDVAWQPVPWDRISPNLKRAVVASEDTEFFFHDGFSRHEMKEALKKAIREGEAPRGASTITQQVAKNLWLTPRRSLTRKLREAMLTRQLEKHLSKRRILELYLNIVEFGPGIYGAEAAARHYFGISAAGLSPRQGAMLAAGLPRPKTWNPSSDSEYYRARVERILQIAERLGFLDQYVGRRAPGAVQVQPPEAIPAP